MRLAASLAECVRELVDRVQFVRQLEEVVCMVLIDLHAWRPRRPGELVAHGDVERVV